MIGRTLSHYEITGRLGAGGMGEVYLARDTHLERNVALKVLPPDLADDPERLKRLVREAKALAALDHPHIVTVFSVEEEDGLHFLTMAYVEGQSLDSLIPERGLEIDALLDLAVPLADALRAAHERGIIHRDLKPANVMVDGDGRLRVLDFGLAKRGVGVSEEMSQITTQGLTEQMTREGTILGSYPYMSPEQAEGRAVDARSDLFSLGTMLYEMSCGVRPFSGGTGIAMITAILRDQPAPLVDKKPAIPQRLVEIIDRCLEKDPDRRYAKAEELRLDLEELRSDVARGIATLAADITATDVPAVDAETGTEGARRPQRRGLRQLMIAAAIVLAVLGGSWIWREIQSGRDDSELSTAGPGIASIAVLPLENLTGDPEQEYFTDGLTEALITDLSKIGALKIISRSSVMRYKSSDQPLSEIAAELGVDAIINGSVVREGDRVAISAQLIEASSDTALWSERYERDLSSILSLQSEIAQTVADEIQITLTPAEEDLLAAAQDVDPDAHEAYLKGIFHLQQFTPQGFERALQYFDTALEIDPDYALAHTGVAKTWGYKSQFGVVPSDVADAELKTALAKALAIDESLAEAQLTLAISSVWHDYDWEAGETAFRRAIELNPNYAEARVFYAHLLAILGRAEESTVQMERALDLDPLNPFFQGLYGIQLRMTGHLEESIDQLLGTLAATPGLGFGRRDVAVFLHEAGRDEESLREFKAHFREIGANQIVEALERGEAAGGYVAALSAAADAAVAMAETRHSSYITLAMLHSAANRTDDALEWIERSYQNRGPDMPYIGALPWFGARADERFQDLLRRMDLTDLAATGRPEDSAQSTSTER